jgi:hypothetical protein
MSGILNKLKDNRTSILLAEIGIWLHLLGKLSEEFIQRQSKQGGSFGYRQICNNNPLQLNNNLFQIIADDWVRTIFDSLSCEIPNFPKSNRSPNSLCEFVKNHLINDIGNFEDCALLKIVATAHHISGAEEKDLPWQQNDCKSKIKQPDKSKTYAAGAFGFEYKPVLEINLTEIRNSLVNNIYCVLKYIKNNSSINESYWQENYPKLIDAFSKAYKVTVGDTQRPVNDVTLWDATSLAAALFKSALVKMILEGWCEPINSTTKETIISWRILRINIDSLSIMAKGVKIGDILGYRKAIEDSISECKKIIEITYCLGNEIYHDETGIYFSFPDVDAVTPGFWNDLINELKEAVHKIEPELSPYIVVSDSIPDFKDLTSQRDSAIKDTNFPYRNEDLCQDFSNLWSNVSQNSEVCPICRLRPMKENSDGCEYCLDRRKGRAEGWIQNPKNTIWLDEVSDHNDRVALLVGSFDLTDWLNGKLISTLAKKTPSSGRVRRCWETTQEFIKSTILGDILNKFVYGNNSPNLEIRKKRIQFKINPNPKILQGATCDIDIEEGLRLSPVCIDQTGGLFISTINLQILEKLGNTINQIASYIENKKIRIKIENSNGWQGDFTISDAKPADEKFQDYKPFVTIYDFPNQFMVLVPAYDALDIAERILEQYEIQSSKVRDRLPFHIGIIAFHRRTPLYIVMDAGKRLISAFKNQSKTINAKVIKIDDIKDPKIGHKVKKLTLQTDPCYSSVPLSWKVSYSTGDPNQDDNWYPYIRFKGSNPNRGHYSFDYDGNGNYVVHVKELRCGDCIQIDTSYFKLFYLENASDRFRVDEGLRPVDEIHRLKDLWKKIEDNLNSKKWSISQLYAFWQEVNKRKEDYKTDKVWKDFTKSAITNILEVIPKDSLFDEVLKATENGLFNLCLYWYLQVKKLKQQKKRFSYD